MEKDESIVVFSLQTTAMDSMTRYLKRHNSGTYIIGINNSCLICDKACSIGRNLCLVL